jgi:hypothetical protein
LYWQHLAFEFGGIQLIRVFAGQGHIAQEQLDGWEKIAQGIWQNNRQLCYEGSVDHLLKHEQEQILQPRVFGIGEFAILATPNLLRAEAHPIVLMGNRMASSIIPFTQSFATYMKGPPARAANPRITNLEHRYTMWFKGEVLPKFKAHAENNWPAVQRFIESVLRIESEMLKNGLTPDR